MNKYIFVPINRNNPYLAFGKEFIFVIMLWGSVPVFAKNPVVNPGFDFTPWDIGWVKDTDTSTSSSSVSAFATVAYILLN